MVGLPIFNRDAYRDFNTMEWEIHLLRQRCAVATDHDKWAAIFDGTVQVASIRIWLRGLTRSKSVFAPEILTDAASVYLPTLRR